MADEPEKSTVATVEDNPALGKPMDQLVLEKMIESAAAKALQAKADDNPSKKQKL